MTLRAVFLRPLLLLVILAGVIDATAQAASRPNILLAISDDQSYPYCSAYGTSGISTPAFDEVARRGALFHNAYAAAPGCSPCRAALLTGRQIWQIEHAGTHASYFGAKYPTYPEVLAKVGYYVGMTGKGWSPGDYRQGGRTENPAGPNFAAHKLDPPAGINSNDYAANFADFLKKRPADQPFCFWYGATEPHRAFGKGLGLKSGKKLEEAMVPPFLPDTPEIRSDILDYAFEIEWFDTHLGRMLRLLEEEGELDNTLIIVTSDNGMAFPRAKANCYDYGIRMPLAICWGDHFSGGRTIHQPVGFVDITATIYEAARANPPQTVITGSSVLGLLQGDRAAQDMFASRPVFSGRERHSSSRFQNLGYPQRALRHGDYLYIWNCRPERWPAGAPQTLKPDGSLSPPHSGYHDIDACPSLTFLVEHREHPEYSRYFHWAVDHRPAVELFNVVTDPGCLENLSGKPEIAELETRLRKQLDGYLRSTGDPRILNGGDIFETYPRVSAIREFPPE